MRKSSAPSLGSLSKKGRFSTPFVSKPPRDRMQEPPGIKSFNSACSARAQASTRSEVSEPPAGDSKPEPCRRPLTEILSLLDHHGAPEKSFATHEHRRITGAVRSTHLPRDPDHLGEHTLPCKLPPAVRDGQESRLAAEQTAADENRVSAVGDSAEVRYFDVVWCKKSARKHKKWEGDAVMEVHRRHVVLLDTDGKPLGQASGYKVKELEDLSDGDLLTVGGKEVEIQNAVRRDVYLARAAASAAPAEPPPPPAAARSMAPAARPFVSPLVGSVSRRPGGGPAQPRFDPRAAGALVMPRPSAQYQWKHNSDGRPLVDVVVDPHVSRHLRPHQRTGVLFLYQCVMGFNSELGHGAILADQMGLGKTLQCIALLWTLLKQGPFAGEPVLRRVLVVTPSSLVNNWVKEFNKWLGKERLSVFAVDQTHSAREFVSGRLRPVMVVSYEMAVRSLDALQQCQFDLMVCDEGHRLKNSAIKTATALASLCCPRRILMTGTPVQNDLLEFFALLQFVNPGVLGSIGEFRRDFERPVVDGRQPGATEEARLLGEERAARLAALTDRFILRRTQEVLDRYLPPKVETVVFCRPSPLQVELYSQVLQSRELRQLLSAESSSAAGTLHLVYIARLRKLCSHPALLLSAEQGESSSLSSLELQFPDGFAERRPSAADSGKMAVLSSLLETLRQSDRRQKIVLISYYTQTLDLLAELCSQHELSCLRLDGSTPSAKRQSLVDQFNGAYGTEEVFLLSAKAGGVGLNLVGASAIVLFDLDWNPANDLQALARVWRDGQKNTTRIYRLLTTGTIEEKIYQRQVSKQGLSAAVVEAGQSAAAAHFSHEELRDLFSLDEETACSTHDLLSCDCDLAGGPCSAPEPPADDAARRPCQLAGPTEVGTGRRRAGMDQLLDWQHYSGPAHPDLVQDAGLTLAGDWISFLFRTTVSASFE